MQVATGDGKAFVFLQGPHGPFFYKLSRIIQDSGATVLKVGFNQGDQYFWPDKDTYLPFTEPEEDWEPYFARILGNGVTDLVIYGDVRPRHATAIKLAKETGVTIHCFEEGYIRPYWATYERGGVNGNSRLMDLSVADMREALGKIDDQQPEAPARWGEISRHAIYGAVYHWQILFRNRRYRNYKTHRSNSIATESFHNIRRVFTMPASASKRRRATRRLKQGGHVYHLALLQLGHDASICYHSDFAGMEEFMRRCAEAFSTSAPKHHHLVFKAHPLEDYRIRLDKLARSLAVEFNLGNRVHFIRGGKLAGLLDQARSVVTVNSTAAQQALWRGLPVKALGRSVFQKPEFTSEQSLEDFFAAPHKPDLNAYRDYRRYLLATSQITGGFYSAKSRVRLTRQVVDMILTDMDPYELLSNSEAAPVQQLKLVQ